MNYICTKDFRNEGHRLFYILSLPKVIKAYHYPYRLKKELSLHQEPLIAFVSLNGNFSQNLKTCRHDLA